MEVAAEGGALTVNMKGLGAHKRSSPLQLERQRRKLSYETAFKCFCYHTWRQPPPKQEGANLCRKRKEITEDAVVR